MTAQEFCYWLNGFGELTTEPPTAEQWKAIKEHLALAFIKVTPPAPGTVLARGLTGCPSPIAGYAQQTFMQTSGPTPQVRC